MSQENIKNGKPKWLRRLERESWQAELIVSGIAIFGSLQLPGLIEIMAEHSISFFPQDSYTGLYFFFLYLVFSSNVLIVSLIVHFVTRALWIGLIGLNSVFPEGIKKENKTYSRHFMERLIADFPKDASHIETLDHFCSVIFSFCALMVMIMLAIAIDMVILFSLNFFLKDYLPEGQGQLLSYIFGVCLFVFSIASLILNSKKLKETTFAKKYHYPLSMGFSKIMLHIFYKPATRISYIFSTNIKLKQFITGLIVFITVVSFFSISQMVNSQMILLAKPDFMFTYYERTDRMLPENYENIRGVENGRILSAVIKSDRVSGTLMKVFVPVLNNEDNIIDNLCGEWESEEELDENEERKQKRNFRLNCLNKYHKFYVNDSLYIVDAKRYSHPNRGEDGIVGYIPTDNFSIGMNLLKIEKIKDEEGNVFRTMNIPFYFEKK